MLQLEGDKDFSLAPGPLWAKVSDARFLRECIPGVDSVTREDADAVVCTLRPGFSFVRGTLDLTLQITDRVPDTSFRVIMNTKGIGTTSTVEALLALAPAEAVTRAHWRVDVKSLGGLLKAVPQGLVRAAAQKVIADALAAVEAKTKEC